MSTWYMDYELGNDATTATPYGWWSVAFTGGMGTEPVEDELVVGDTSGSWAYVTYVDTTGGSWVGSDASGTIYFYGKTAPFQAETVSCAVGGDFDIGEDFTYCAWKTTTLGATSGRTAPGDVIKIAKSGDPVSLGNGTWTDCPTTQPSRQAISTSTNASPINIYDTNHGFSTGDIVQIYNHATNFTANGIWKVTWVDNDNYTLDGSTGVAAGSSGYAREISHKAVVLATAQTKNICICEDTWTAANGATVTRNTTYYRTGDGAVKVVKSSPANDTLYAYYDIGGGGGIDFSSYQRVTFWLQNATAILANDWKLCLCSDAAGTTIVDTMYIPAIPSTGEWCPLTITGDNANLGASIQSVALYSGSSAASTSGIYLDNIVACTTTGLNLHSLISKNSSAQGGTEAWYAIRSISEDGLVLRLDGSPNDTAVEDLDSPTYSYNGTTETVTTYKREPILTTLVSSSSTTVQTLNESGTAGNNIEYQGGYNPDDNTQDGETIFSGQTGNGYGLSAGRDYITLNRLNFYRYNYGIRLSGAYNTVTNIFCCNNLFFNFDTSAIDNTINISNCNNSGSSGLVVNNDAQLNNFTIINCNGNGNYGVYAASGSRLNEFTITSVSLNDAHGINLSDSYTNIFYNVLSKNNNDYGVNFDNSFENKFYDITTQDNDYSFNQAGGTNYFYNCTMDESTQGFQSNNALNYYTYSNNHNDTAGAFKAWTAYGIIESDNGADRHTASGICWKMSAVNAAHTSDIPVKLTIAKIAVEASKLVTVNAWMKKSHATNIVGKLVCPGGQIAGVPADVVDTAADVLDTYSELEITFTPTAAGVVEIEAQCYYDGGSASIYVDDMTIAQAT